MHTMSYADGVRVLEEWASKFGRLFEGHFGSLKIYSIADPTLVQKVLQSTNPLHLNKPQYIYGKFLVEWVANGILNSDNSLWHGRRQMVDRSFTYKSLRTYVKIMSNHSTNPTKELWELSANGDFQVAGEQVCHLIHFHAIKIIGGE